MNNLTKKILIIIVVIGGTFPTNAQDTGLNRTFKLKDMAESAVLKDDPYAAIYYYEKYLTQKPNKKKIKLKLALLYSNVHTYRKAINLYLTLSDKNFTNDVYYQLALCCKQLGLYDSSLVYFNQCTKNKLNPLWKGKYQIELNGVLMAKGEPKEENVIEIYHLDSTINKPHMEYSPSFYSDSVILYSSIEPLGYNNPDRLISKIYKARLYDSIWVRDNSPQLQFQFPGTFPGNGCFSLDKHRYYFSQCFLNWQNKTICQLYYSEITNGKYGIPQKIEGGVNDLFYSSSQPTVGITYNTNLEIIYYVSDRPGGIGGMDIWYIVYNKKRKTFSGPTNVGNKINTPWNEATPYYNNSTKTLYFSSEGRESYGGYDVYRSTGELKSWFKARNIGNYINTNADELSYILNSRQNNGFFISNRKESYHIYDEYCCYDLYYFKFKSPENLDIKGKLLVSMNPEVEKILKMGVEFRDTVQTTKYVEKAVVSLYLKDNSSKDSLFIGSDTTDQKGNYGFNVERNQDYALIIRDQKDEYKGKIDVTTNDSVRKESNDIILGSKEIESLPDMPLIIKNITYEFGKSELSLKAKHRLDSTLVYLMTELKDIRIEISSYTDNLGEADYNKKLSEKRAQNVMAYLNEKGIDIDRMEIKGLGEDFPIAPNQNADGSDNPQGREKNRRTEFKIIGKYKQQSIRF